jgi:hypothetical protein
MNKPTDQTLDMRSNNLSELLNRSTNTYQYTWMYNHQLWSHSQLLDFAKETNQRLTLHCTDLTATLN